MELSVIVPVYNMAGGGKLKYCINALVNQTLKDMEIIAVDDASTDNSLEILRDFEKKYPGRVKAVASPENRRQGGARNLGLKEATGRYIGFMDADDWMVPDMYERMLSLAIETGADVVGTDMCRVYEHTMVPTEREACNHMSQTGIFDHDKRRDYLLNSGPLGTKIYARKVFYDPLIVFPEKIFYEDNAVATDIGMRIEHFEHIPEANVFYYQHSDSTTHYVTMNNIQDRMTSMRVFLEHSRNNGAFDEYPEVVEYHFATLFYKNTLFSYMQSNIKKDPAFVEKLGKELVDNFPNFRDNPYFQKAVNDYEMKLINLQLENTGKFFFIYALKQISKKIRSFVKK